MDNSLKQGLSLEPTARCRRVLVRAGGLEPPTYRFEAGCSIPLMLRADICLFHKFLAEGVGFEPTGRYFTTTDFQGRRISPLCHPSKMSELVAHTV